MTRVDTADGALDGTWEGTVAVFRGLPFAAPPVGALRWRPPAPVTPWAGVRPAAEFAPAPLQPSPPRDSIMWHTNFADRQALVMSEDCLYLNVWTPSPGPAAALPVMVWIHGGGNRYGYGSQNIHNGAALARRGVVVVTLNHRLGSLGFLAHPDLAAEDEHGASGNYGLLDIVAVLQWVRRSIAAFGGDPDRVTVAGNSAGAAHITHLMAAPECRGLFRAAIGQSAAGIFRAEGPAPTQEAAQQQGATLFKGRSIESLRRVSGVELVLTGHFGPIVDGRLLTRDSQDVFLAGEQAPVPLLVGANADEGANYTRPGDESRLPAGSAEYPPGAARLFVGESRFNFPVWRWAVTHATSPTTTRTGVPTWLYRFEHEPPLPTGLDLAAPPDGRPGYGVYHTAELPYTADNLAMRDWPWTDVDHDLAAAMGDAWAAFVTDLDPGPHWPAFDGTDDGAVLVFGKDIHVSRPRRLAAMHLLDQLPRPL
ncbi:carboxylesterase family protein [Actinoplanes sp. NPDC026619]|uniref:carboxylesterase/lipase family protein n=1 Tax=Actinoplanes sp. NPDC026619 TaxID=3155798 RepID=UPI003405E899